VLVGGQVLADDPAEVGVVLDSSPGIISLAVTGAKASSRAIRRLSFTPSSIRLRSRGVARKL
jgi:hypothetical protein